MNITAAQSHGNRGCSLEAVVMASQCGIVRLEKMPTGARFIKGRWIPVKGPVDYVGTVVGPGRSIVFDAKQCHLKGRWDYGNRDHMPAHQVAYLVAQGGAGAIAGVIVEATHESLAAFYWCGWRGLRNEPSMKWDDPRLVRLGPNNQAIDFRRVPGVVEVRKAVGLYPFVKFVGVTKPRGRGWEQEEF